MSEQLQLRQEWNEQAHAEQMNQPGVMYDPDTGTFAPPERLAMVEDTLTMNALRTVIAQGRSETGAIDQQLEPLTRSAQWNMLTDKPGTETNYDVYTDAALTEFFESRAAEVDAARPRIEAEYQQATEQVKAGVLDGIRQGYIPQAVESRLDTLSLTTMQVVDGALLQDDHNHAGRTEAMYTTEDKILLAHDISMDVGVAVGHEDMHKLAGGTFVQHPTDDRLVRTRMGLKHRDKHEGLDEALTQHAIMGAVTGDFETIDPDKRQDGDKTYYAERKILAAFTERSAGIIETRALTNAFFEDTENTADTLQHRRALVAASRDAYGPGSLEKLDQILSEAGHIDFENADAMQQLQMLVDRVQPGTIDTNGLS